MLLSASDFGLTERAAANRLCAVVAIPARNEAERLPACLYALARQQDLDGAPLPGGLFAVVAFANNCSDETAAAALELAAGLPFALRVVARRLPVELSHAGGARRAAMDLASDWLGEEGASDGVILTTDADSRATPTWVAETLRAFSQGAEAALGRISLDEEGELLPPLLHARGKLESVYEDLLAELSALLDPQTCNPWPHHTTVSGASLALTRELYRRVGGLPLVSLGEDKALVAELRRHDARLRYAPEIAVITSGRVVGRAPGGVADTLALRSQNPAAPCDEALEPVTIAFARALWRGRLRREGARTPRWRSALRISAPESRRAEAEPTFGRLWERIEQTSPRLARRPLRPDELPREIERATRALRRMQARLAAREDVEPVLGRALAVGDGDDAGEPLDQEVGGVLAR